VTYNLAVMLGAFLFKQAPNGATWERYCRDVKPKLDRSGYVTGAWGECMHDAVHFEGTNDYSSMRGYNEEGPAGQVLNFLRECGFGNFEGAMVKNEEATHHAFDAGNEAFVFEPEPGQAVMGQVVQGQSGDCPGQYGAPMQAMMGAQAMQGQFGGRPGYMGAPQQHVMGNLVQADPYKILSSLPMVQIEEKMNILEVCWASWSASTRSLRWQTNTL